MTTQLPRVAIKPGQWVQLMRLPPPDPNTGGGIAGLQVGDPGVIRQIGHDTERTPLVLVEFAESDRCLGGSVWVMTDSVKAIQPRIIKP